MRDAKQGCIDDSGMHAIPTTQPQVLDNLPLYVPASQIIKANDVFHNEGKRLNGLDDAYVLPIQAVPWVFNYAVVITHLGKCLTRRATDNDVNTLALDALNQLRSDPW